ncbi:hypothetical protein D3C87_333340 [compost metagenome]
MAKNNRMSTLSILNQKKIPTSDQAKKLGNKIIFFFCILHYSITVFERSFRYLTKFVVARGRSGLF